MRKAFAVLLALFVLWSCAAAEPVTLDAGFATSVDFQ